MSRFFACAGLGIFLTLAASVLAIFAQIGQINSNIVPRNIRMVAVSTGGLGQATGVGSGLYGQGSRAEGQANTGVRQSYEWGLWNYCSHDSQGGNTDYCSGTNWANGWQPVPAILVDAPQADQTQLANSLGSGTFTASDYLSRYSKAAFYLLFIGTVAGGLALILGFLAHRIAFLLCALLTFFAFLCTAVGCVIWTVIIARAKSSVSSVGIDVHYGDGLWIYWAATGCLFFATLPFIFGCIAGRDRY